MKKKIAWSEKTVELTRVLLGTVKKVFSEILSYLNSTIASPDPRFTSSTLSPNISYATREMLWWVFCSETNTSVIVRRYCLDDDP